MGIMLRQARELGIDAVFMGNYGIEGRDLLTTAGDAANGVYYTSVPIEQAFINRYSARYGKSPTIGAPLGYDVLRIVSDAIRAGGTSPDGIASALRSKRGFDGVTGKIVFDAKGDAVRKIIIKTVENGRFIAAAQ
jgi:branched-chain amino acid transport system substrate-binding protein